MNVADILGLLLLAALGVMPFIVSPWVSLSRGGIVSYVMVMLVYTSIVMFTVIGSPAWMNDDALRMYAEASSINSLDQVHFALGYELYRNFFAFLFLHLGSSVLLGQAVSIFVAAVSAVVFLKLNRILNHGAYEAFLLPFVFLSMMTLQMMTQMMRESFELLFFMLFAFFFLKMHIGKHTNKYFFGALGAAVFMGATHKMLAVFALVVLAFMYIWQVNSNGGAIKKKKLLALVAISVILYFFLGELVYVFDMPGLGAIKSLMVLNFIDAINGYRDILPVGRTSYHIAIDGSSVWAICFSLLQLVAYYFLMPFPWLIHGVADIYAFSEVVIRLALIFFSFVAMNDSEGKKKRFILGMLVLYFIINAFWAMGVGNYGTALRHHLISEWILILIGGGRLVDFLIGWIPSGTKK